MSHAQTGPLTPEGKLASSQNAFKHGLTAINIDRFPAAIRDAYAEFLAHQFAEWQPATANEEIFVHRYAFAQFQVLRAQSILASAQEKFLLDPADETVAKLFHSVSRYYRTLERSAQSALKELRLFIADRMAAPAADHALQEATGTNAVYPTVFPHHLVTDPKLLRQSPETNALRFAYQNNPAPNEITNLTAGGLR